MITVGKIREYFAELSGADFTEPITVGMFVSIVAWVNYQRSEDETPYWRSLKDFMEIVSEIKKHRISLCKNIKNRYYLLHDILC